MLTIAVRLSGNEQTKIGSLLRTATVDGLEVV